MVYFKKVNQKNLAIVLSHFAKSKDVSWTEWFSINLEKEDYKEIFENLNKKAIYTYYSKKITKGLRTELKIFTENHFEMTKTTKTSERGAIKFLNAVLKGADRQMAPAKIHCRGFADVSQSKKSGKAASRLTKSNFR